MSFGKITFIIISVLLIIAVFLHIVLKRLKQRFIKQYIKPIRISVNDKNAKEKIKIIFNAITTPSSISTESPLMSEKMVVAKIIEKGNFSPLKLHAIMFMLYTSYLVVSNRELFKGAFYTKNNHILLKELEKIIGAEDSITLPKTEVLKHGQIQLDENAEMLLNDILKTTHDFSGEELMKKIVKDFRFLSTTLEVETYTPEILYKFEVLLKLIMYPKN